jgi:phosphate butyryltransferase
MGIKKLEELLELKNKGKMKLAVVASHDEEVLEAVVESSKLGISEPILIGDKDKTIAIAQEKGLDISEYKIIDEKDLNLAAEIGVKMVSNGEANFIMKGLVDTSILLKAVLNKEWGLRTESLLSHVMVYQIPSYKKLIYLTDGGMNLQPSLEDKVKIIENAVMVAKSLGRKEVKVACLAAKEKIDSKMIATVEANELKIMCENGKFSEGTIVDGPMALDLAVSSTSAEVKGYKSPVAGDADILLVPNIEMGNGIGKSITYFAEGKSAGIIMGAKVPIVLVSRADDHETKLYSIALGSAVAANIR